MKPVPQRPSGIILQQTPRLRWCAWVVLLYTCAGLFTSPSLRASTASDPAPILEPVDVEVQGMKVRVTGLTKPTLADAKIVVEEQIRLTEDRVPTGPLADDFAFFLKQRLLELGYADAQVQWSIEGNLTILQVIEGQRYTVGEISIEGEATLPRESMVKYLLLPVHEKLNESGNHPPFIEGALKEGGGYVQRYMQSEGFLDAVAEEPIFTPRPETATVDIKVLVTPGARYNIGKVTIDGDLLNKSKIAYEQVKDLDGQPYSEVLLETRRKAILGIYQQLGHFKAEVTWEAHPEERKGGHTPVRYVVTPGPRHHIAGLVISPDFSKGATRLIRSSFRPAVGRVYAPADLELMNRRLLDTEVFSKLELTPKIGEGDTLTLEVTGEEAKRKRLSIYAGYETFQGPLAGVELRAVNFFDTGDAVVVKTEVNARGLNGAVKWLDPAIFNTSWSLGMEIAADTFSFFDYDRKTLAFRPTLTRQWNKRLTTTIFGEYSLNSSESSVLTPDELGPDSYNISSVGASVVLDFRDSPVIPARGWFASGTVVGSSGGDVSFMRSDVVFSYYQPITKKFRTALSARSSAIAGSDGIENLPIDLRLFNGGATSVRSFPEREMGLKSHSGETPLGGTLSQVFSVEFSYEIASNLELALFGDAGTLSRDDENVFAMPTDLSYAVGLGIRYKLPIGPLRIDYGYNPMREEGDPAGALHITFGFAF